MTTPFPNVRVVQPRIARGPAVESRLCGLLRGRDGREIRAEFANAVHWLYTPMMEPQIDLFPNPRAIIYDCMDELSKFAMAPPGLPERERRLLARADTVFAGGFELGAAKARVHSSVHVFGCGVDFDHFRRAATERPAADLTRIPGPRLGYIGVVDERLDYGLLASLADQIPEASVVLVGPFAKVDPSELPQRPNMHYLGSRDYRDLPEYLAGFDVCLMPFAMNEASYFINPTKTLEYLASGKPVVSTPVRDVVRQFRDVVRVADANTFVEAVRGVLSRPPDPVPGVELARSASWDKTVAVMELYAALALASKS